MGITLKKLRNMTGIVMILIFITLTLIICALINYIIIGDELTLTKEEKKLFIKKILREKMYNKIDNMTLINGVYFHNDEYYCEMNTNNAIIYCTKI